MHTLDNFASHTHPTAKEAASAWEVFCKLADQQKDLALLVLAHLPAGHVQQLHRSCSKLRRLVNEHVRQARLPAAGQSPGLGGTFPAINAITYRQHGLSPDDSFLAGLDKQLGTGGRLPQQLRRLSVDAQCHRDMFWTVHHASLLRIAGALPQLRTLECGANLQQRHTKDAQQQQHTQHGPYEPPRRGLRELVLHRQTLNPTTALPASGLGHLQALVLHRCALHPRPECIFDALARLPNLTRLELDLRRCVLSGNRLSLLASLPRLRSLSLSPHLATDSYEPLAQLQQLTALRLGDRDSADTEHVTTSVAALTSLRALRSLEIWDKFLERDELGLLALPALTHLLCCIEGSAVQPPARRAPLGTSLRSLAIITGDAYDAAEVGLARFELAPGAVGLRTLVGYGDAVYGGATAADLAALQLHTTLQELDLGPFAAGVDDGCFARGMTPLVRLRSLVLDGLGEVSDAGLAALGSLTQLTLLHLQDGQHITDTGVLEAMNALRRLDSFRLHIFPHVTAALVGAMLARHPALLCRVGPSADLIQVTSAEQCAAPLEQAHRWGCIIDFATDFSLCPVPYRADRMPLLI